MVSLTSALASAALKSLGSLALKEIAAAWNFESDLLKLTNTITIIRDVLVAHESGRQRLDVENLNERLKDVVHEADDLLDKFITLAERKKVTMTHGRFTEKVRIFFSRENQFINAWTISGEIKRIRKALHDIDRDNQFASMLLSREPGAQVGLVKREETCSFIVDDDVIGRDDDKRKIVDVLLRDGHHDDTRMNMVVLPIVGIGGLGKTTIAQLVFNDEEIKSHFKLTKWVCIGDDGLGLKLIIKRIIMSFSNCSDDQSLEYLHGQLREEIGGRKYLLVLDDLWEEDSSVLSRLKELLAIGGKGSALLVTTRSTYTAEEIGTVSPMELQVLSDDASWTLFEKMTCMSEKHKKDEHLVQIGKAIVKKCGNLPLAIKVIGSMLRGQDEKGWLYFRNHDLAKIDNDGRIIPLLKLSYYRLSPHLKHCFAYCSLFPKDYEMETIKLCQLWVAQGFIPSSPPPDKSLEDVAKECFNGLLNRCFFQDIKRNEWGEIQRFKMHDVIHDLATEVAGKEFLLVDGSRNHGSSIEGRQHLSLHRSFFLMPSLPSSSQGGNHIRTFLRTGYYGRIPRGWEASNFISSFECIKVLDLRDLTLEKLPDSIGNLIHIRYLDLSCNNFEMLPKSITGLHNLQTLILLGCGRLKELPCDLNKLVNLQNLDLMFTGLEYMPSGMGSLTCLQRLNRFVVGENKSASGFGDLSLLNSLRGSLQIDIRRKGISMPITTEASCLLNKDSLTSLEIRYRSVDEPVDDSQDSEDEELLECLQPHGHLKCFRLQGPYGGQKFPSWMSMNYLALVLPNLVEIVLSECTRCQNLPLLSLLPSVRTVILKALSGLEYIESRSYEASTSSKSEAFFPSLRRLELRNLPNVRGWWGPTGVGTDLCCDEQVPLPSFPSLEFLSIWCCPNMTSMPLCPGVESLSLGEFNENLHIIMETDESPISAAASLHPSSSTISSSAAPNSCSSTPPPPVKFLEIDNTYYNHLPKQCFRSVTDLTIYKCRDVALSKSFLHHFTEIVELRFFCSPELDLSAAHNEEDDQLQWKFLGQLRRLTLWSLPKLTTLPKGLEYLTNLQQLSISYCDNLAELPEWIGQLSSLQSLEIEGSPRLKSLPDGIQHLTSLRRITIERCGSSLTRRCREPTGEDWPKIQHIPWSLVSDW